MNEMDALTYFLTNSSLIIGVTAVLFFFLGTWFAYLLWGRFKRRFRTASDAIESLKHENAQLKRRITEASRPQTLAAALRASLPPRATSYLTQVTDVVEPSLEVPSDEQEEDEGKSVWDKFGVDAETVIEAKGEAEEKKEDVVEPKVSEALVATTTAALAPEVEKEVGTPSVVEALTDAAADKAAKEPEVELPSSPPEVVSVQAPDPDPTESISVEVHATAVAALASVTIPTPKPAPVPTPPSSPPAQDLLQSLPKATGPVASLPLPTKAPSRGRPDLPTAFASTLELPPLPAIVAGTESKAFTVWTEDGWQPTPVRSWKQPPARAFTVWTEYVPVIIPKEKPALPAGVFVTSPSQTHTLSAIAALPLMQDPLPVEPMIVVDTPPSDYAPPFPPPSQAFGIWTEESWQAPSYSIAPLPAGAGFSVWTDHGFEPRGRSPLPASQAFSVWTESDWVIPFVSQPPAPSSAAFSLWTEPDFSPLGRGAIIPSTAFSVWTEPGWEPTPVYGVPLPPSQAFSIWTLPEFEPLGRGPVMPSQAFCVWTEADWIPSVSPSFVLPSSTAFSIWTLPEFTPLARGPVQPSRAFSLWIGEPPEPQAAITSAGVNGVSPHPAAPPAPEANFVPPAAPAKAKHSSQSAIAAAAAAAVKSVSTPVLGSTAEQQAAAGSVTVAKGQPTGRIVPRSSSSLFSRAFAALKSGLGILPDAISPPPTIVAKPTSAPKPESPKISKSKAFTLWTEAPAAPVVPPVRQREALASIIESHFASTPDSVTHAVPTNAIEAFQSELRNGLMRNDFLLGMLYLQKPADADDLTQLHGIAETLERHLHNHGIFTFKQIAWWTPDQVENFSHRLAFGDRIRRERWVEQAKALQAAKTAPPAQERAV